MTRETPARFRRSRYFADKAKQGATLGKLPPFGVCFRNILMTVVLLMEPATALTATQTSQQLAAPRGSRGHGEPTKADVLRGAYGPYRSNNDLLFYHLDVRVAPDKKLIGGKNTIRFKMLKDDTRIQLDLADGLSVDKILLGSTPLRYER